MSLIAFLIILTLHKRFRARLRPRRSIIAIMLFMINDNWIDDGKINQNYVRLSCTAHLSNWIGLDKWERFLAAIAVASMQFNFLHSDAVAIFVMHFQFKANWVNIRRYIKYLFYKLSSGMERKLVFLEYLLLLLWKLYENYVYSLLLALYKMKCRI